MSHTVFSIGHSTRTSEELLGLLRESSVQLVVDVRKLPGSRRAPQFDQDVLAAFLARHGIGYRWAEDLTGRRPVSHEVPFSTNAWWRNRSFHNYADHALGADVAAALAQLQEDARSAPVAVMCSEAVWWRCHRRIIADHLLARGEQVQHILGPGRADPAQLSAGARRGADGTLTYPAVAGGA